MARRPSATRKKNVWGSGLNQPGWEKAWQQAAGVTPPTSAPPPSNPITPQVQPLDPIYLEQTGVNQLGLDNSLAGIEYQRGQLAQSTGFNALGQLDLSNPYNQATLLQRSYQQSQRGTENSMAARGQLYSGATQRGLDEGTFQYGRNYDALRRNAEQGYQRLSQAEQEAKQGKLQGDLDAQSDSLGRATDQRPTDPGAINFADLDRLIKAQNAPKPIKKTPNVKPGVSRAVGRAYKRNKDRF